MALELSVTLASDISLNTYIKISQIQIYPKWQISFYISHFKDRTAALAKKAPVWEYPKKISGADLENHFSIEDQKEEGNDILTLLYRYLKTLPEFAEAEDVLEEGQEP